MLLNQLLVQLLVFIALVGKRLDFLGQQFDAMVSLHHLLHGLLVFVGLVDRPLAIFLVPYCSVFFAEDVLLQLVQLQVYSIEGSHCRRKVVLLVYPAFECRQLPFDTGYPIRQLFPLLQFGKFDGSIQQVSELIECLCDPSEKRLFRFDTG